MIGSQYSCGQTPNHYCYAVVGGSRKVVALITSKPLNLLFHLYKKNIFLVKRRESYLEIIYILDDSVRLVSLMKVLGTFIAGYYDWSEAESIDVTDVTFPTSADADVRLLTSADADLHNPKQNACVTIEFSEI